MKILRYVGATVCFLISGFAFVVFYHERWYTHIDEFLPIALGISSLSIAWWLLKVKRGTSLTKLGRIVLNWMPSLFAGAGAFLIGVGTSGRIDLSSMPSGRTLDAVIALGVGVLFGVRALEFLSAAKAAKSQVQE